MAAISINKPRAIAAALAILLILFFLRSSVEDAYHSSVGLLQSQSETSKETHATPGEDAGMLSSDVQNINNSPTINGNPKPKVDEIGPEKAVVMGRLSKENVDWVAKELPDWTAYIYTVDDPTSPGLHTPKNKGKEAMPYLTYLINNYDTLGLTIAFVHSHRDGWPAAWHTDSAGYSTVTMLDTLKTDFVQKNGYVNLRCIHNPGCPDETHPFRTAHPSEHEYEAAIPAAWEVFFNNTNVPDVLATPCCAQFAVSREQVLKRPREDYIRFRQWLLDTDVGDFDSGRVFEYLWHVIFGKEAVYCPSLVQCYCDVYGRC